MNGHAHRLLHSLANRWVFVALACLLTLQLGAAPALAQNGGNSSLSTEQQQKLRNQLKSTYAEGAKAGNAENYQQAISSFEEALKLARKLELSSIASKIQQNLINSYKGAASKATENENYSRAIEYYDRVLEERQDDAIVHFNRGIAFMSMDSTDAGLNALQTAIEVGNQTGNTRVAGRATERIRSEFLNIASTALQGDNPSQDQINTALDGLDRMREYVQPNSESLFYRALALFEGGQHQQAIETARKGLEMHQGSRSDAAKFYFIIAESQMTLGSTSEACQTFENAAFGDYKARAEHYLKNECE